MLKILLTVLIALDILLFLLMIYCLSGISILLSGLGLVISGELAAAVLSVIQIVLLLLTYLVYKRLRVANDLK